MPASRAGAIILFIGTVITGCVDPYNPEIKDSQASLVVEASITDRPGWQIIKLSRSSPLIDNEPHPETDAFVTVSDDLGRVTEFLEQEPGFYTTWMSAGDLSAEVYYRLHIVTSDGEVYESEPELFPAPSPPINSVYWEFDTVGTADRTMPLKGIRFYLDLEAEEEQANNFRWELVETWEYHTAHLIDYYYDGILHEWPDGLSYHICWFTGKINNIYMASTRHAESNSIKGFPLHYVSEETSRLQTRYSLQVLQYSLSDIAYDYWNQIAKQNQESGGIHERQPDYISGNIYNMNNQDEKVLGFFNLCSVSEKRIFVNGISALRYPAVDCTIDTIWQMSYKPAWLSIPFFLVSFNPRGKGAPYGVGTRLCFDCRNGGGTIIKPDFWE